MSHSIQRGGCQCGAIRYALKGEPLVLYRCHCTECQTQSGSGFGMSMWVRRGDFQITQGTPKSTVRVADSGREIRGEFCGDCGTRLFGKSSMLEADYVVLKPGTLDDATNLEPQADIWLQSKQSWFTAPETTEHFQGQPDFVEWLKP